MSENRKRTEYLSAVDTAWLRMETPTNLMMITGLVIFDDGVDFERLKATLEYRFVHQFRRFRQRIVQPDLPFAAPRWEDDPHFDLSSHVRRIALPEPADKATLQTMVGELMSTPLDYSKPLWQFHLIESHNTKQSALLIRLHHSIADGIALVQVMLSLTDRDPDAPWPGPEPARRQPRGWSPLAPLLRPARKVLRTMRQITRTSLEVGLSIARDPEQLVELTRAGSDIGLTTARLLLMSPDPRTVLKGPLGVPKRAAWSEPIPLSEIKIIGRAMGATINDLLLTAVAGALRRYMLGREKAEGAVDFRAIIPVNLRPSSRKIELGNKFGLVFLTLPVGIADPVERLRELKRRMDDLKDSPEPLVAFGILNIMGAAPAQIEHLMVDIFEKKATAVMTNVPGPREQLYFAGSPIGHMMFWVPQSGRLGLGVSIFSYNDQVMIGVASDAGLVPDPDALISAFHEELRELRVHIRDMIRNTARQMEVSLAPTEDALYPPEDSPRRLELGIEEHVPGDQARDWDHAERDMELGKPTLDATRPVGHGLTQVRGIGPAYAQKLELAGIADLAALAQSSPEILSGIIQAAAWQEPDYEDWIDQARALSPDS